jgi:hypothetical protein
VLSPIIPGILVSIYGQEKVVMDTAVWLDASEDEQLPVWQAGLSPAQVTMAALREARLLDRVMETKDGLVVWPLGMRYWPR